MKKKITSAFAAALLATTLIAVPAAPASAAPRHIMCGWVPWMC